MELLRIYIYLIKSALKVRISVEKKIVLGFLKWILILE